MNDIETLSAEVVARFAAAGKTIGTAESLTAGMISASVASVSGASAVLMGGIVSYDPRVKHELLGVPQEVIDTVGVVSEPCAKQMALGAREALKVDIAVSATGIAGPTGGTAETPVGTVFIGVSSERGARAEKFLFEGSRQEVREASVCAALNMALEELAIS